MKHFILTYIIVCFLGCSTKTLIKPVPTMDDKLDVYINEFVETPNLTTCEKVVDLRRDIHHFICVETETDRTYFIPIEEWENNFIGDHFIRVSRLDLRKRLTNTEELKKFVCGFKNIDCDNLDKTPPLEPLIPYLEVK